MSRAGSARARSVSMRSRTRSRSRSSSIISTQHDQRATYRSRGGRRSRRGRRRRRFRYNVLNTLMNEQPLQIFTRKRVENLTSGNDAQGFYGVGIFQTRYDFERDLFEIFGDAGFNLADDTKRGARINIKSVCLDVEIKNNGDTDIIMDVYELLNRKDIDTTATYASQFSDLFDNQTTITAASVTDPAVSVFENANFCQHYKVLSKREVLIPQGDIITMQMRSSKDRRIQGEAVMRYLNALPKVSRCYFFMWHGPPEPNGTSPRLASTSLTIAWQKSYKYGLAPTPKQNPGIHNI